MRNMVRNSRLSAAAALVAAGCALWSCGTEDEGSGRVRIQNDFNNPDMPFQPPWTICESSYALVDFGKVDIDATSAEHEVPAGLDYVLMVAAWDDPACAPENCLPIASATEEEVVDGQTRTIAINLASHQGACPPEGVAPIPQEQYDRILALWPDYGFRPYAQRTENPQCVPTP
jgi:hypothetical protein